MNLDIVHQISCRYDRPVSSARLAFRVFPPGGPDQKVVRQKFQFTGRILSGRRTLNLRMTPVMDRDAWGNTRACLSCPEGLSGWSVDVRLRVRTFRTDPYADYSRWNYLSAPAQWPREVRMYLSSSEDAWDTDPSVRAWAESTVHGILGAFRQVEAIMKRIYSEFSFEVGSTGMGTLPSEVLVQKKGVCQDFTNLMIVSARSLGLPARYVSGYIYTGKRKTAPTNHAWAEVYFPEIGWAGFDAANGMLVCDTHVRVAQGAWFSDAAPMTGTFVGKDVRQSLTSKIRVGAA